MSVLRFKDKNNVWHDVYALKGEKGDKGDKGDAGESPSEEALDAILAVQNALIGDDVMLEETYGMITLSVESVDGKIKTYKIYGREVTA